jgi:hypothetical protein
MTVPRITRCCDGHFRRIVYGLGPYIADYPEQALLACVVQNWCPKYFFYFTANKYRTLTIPFKRCTAPHDNLDGDIGGPHSHAHTDALLSSGTITLREVWDSYGIVGELLVSKYASP